MRYRAKTSLKFQISWQLCTLSISEDGRYSTETRTRIAMAKTAFHKRKELFTQGISLKVIKSFVKTLIWSSVFLYGAETWTLMKSDIKRLEALEMWCWRIKNAEDKYNI